MATTIGTTWTELASKSTTYQGAKVTFYLDAKRGTQSVTNNTTPIDVRLRSVFSGNYLWTYGYSFSATYCTTKSSSTGQWNVATETILSGSKTVSHNADGTWNGTITANAYLNSICNLSLSASVSVPTIPRASSPTFSPSSLTLNGSNTFNISMNRASTSFTHNVSWTVGSKSGTLGTAITDSVSWTPPMNLITEFYANASINGTLTTRTYNGSTLIGTTTKSFTLNNPGGDLFTLSQNNITVSSRNTNLNINCTPRYSGFGHNVYYKVSGGGDRAIQLGSPSFPINWKPYLVLQEMATKTTTTVEVIIRTTYNNTVIYDGEKKQTLTLNVDTSVYKPTISAITLTEQDSIASTLTSANSFIRYISDILVGATCGMVADSGSTLKNVKIECGSASVSQTSGTVSTTFTNINAQNVKITATDTRGVSVSKTEPFTLIPYVLLTIAASQERDDPTSNDVIASYNGAYFNGSFGQVNNTLTFTYKYRENGQTAWTDGTGSLTATYGSNSTYEGSATLAESFDYTKQYDLIITATDKIMSVSRRLIVYQGIPVWHWGQDHFDVEGDILIHRKGVPTDYAMFSKEEVGILVNNSIYEMTNTQKILPNGDDSASYWQGLNTGLYWVNSEVQLPNLPSTYGFVYVMLRNTEFSATMFCTGTNKIYKKWGSSSTNASWRDMSLDNPPTTSTGITFNSTVLNTNYGYSLMKYANGMVELRFNATWKANSTGALFFTLPVGFRPTSNFSQNIRSNNGATYGYMSFSTNGQVNIYNLTNNGDGYRGIFMFYAGQ